MLPPEFIIEINDDKNNNYMIGLTCSDHKVDLEKKFYLLQKNNTTPAGKIVFTKIKVVHTDCVKGTIEDQDEISIKRL